MPPTDRPVPDHPGMPPTSQPGRRPDKETDEDRFYNGVSFASDTYVPWVFGKLKLRDCDTSRLGESGCPVLRSHQPDNLVGAVLTVNKRAGQWRSDWRLPKIASNRRTFDEMDSGILRGVSVGGRLFIDSLVVDNEEEAQTIDDMLFSADWQLVEESLTGLPADTSASVDRIMGDVLRRDAPAIFDSLISESGIFTTASPNLQRRVEALQQSHNESISARKRAEVERMTTQTISPDALERAISDALERHDGVKRLAEVPDKLDTIASEQASLKEAYSEFGTKLNQLQFQPGGAVLQMSNWRPGADPVLDLGKVLRLTQTSDAGFPELPRDGTTLEESFLEQQGDLGMAGRNVVARIPWEALAERQRQMDLRRTTLANAAGARESEVQVLGNAGLVLSAWSPILARMDVQLGVTGGQKLPWLTTQLSAAGGSEGSDLVVSDLIFDNQEILPVSIASAYRMTTSLRAVDDGTFNRVAIMAIQDVLLDQTTGQILDGAGSTGNEIAGIWGTTGVQNHDYGAAQSDFTRGDALTFLDTVRLAKTDGAMYVGALSTTLWKLCEATLRGGSASDRYLLEMTGPDMGEMENEAMFHYADLKPSGVTDAGLFFKADRVRVWFWGSSLSLELVPELKRSDVYRMVAEVNARYQQPTLNISRTKQT